jgi:hypothetical protein
MASKALVLEEVLAILSRSGASLEVIKNFKKKAEDIFRMKVERTYDDISVASGFGQKSQRGYVDLCINDEMKLQMDVRKAKEVGLMLIEAAEAATSDEIFMQLLERVGIRSTEVGSANLLLELREIRQGSRGVVKVN